MSAAQASLFEPSGAEVGVLALAHMRKASQFGRVADVCKTRGWQTLYEAHARLARDHEDEAECLAMLADFERLGRVHSS